MGQLYVLAARPDVCLVEQSPDIGAMLEVERGNVMLVRIEHTEVNCIQHQH